MPERMYRPSTTGSSIASVIRSLQGGRWRRAIRWLNSWAVWSDCATSRAPTLPGGGFVRGGLDRRGQLLIEVKSPIEAARGLVGRHTWPQQQQHADADHRQRQRAQDVDPQRPAPEQVPAQANTPDARGQRRRPQQRPDALPGPAVGRKLIQLLDERILHKE